MKTIFIVASDLKRCKFIASDLGIFNWEMLLHASQLDGTWDPIVYIDDIEIYRKHPERELIDDAVRVVNGKCMTSGDMARAVFNAVYNYQKELEDQSLSPRAEYRFVDRLLDDLCLY